MSERAKTHSCALTAVRQFERLRKLPNLYILMTILVSFDFAVDPCYEYKNLSHPKRKSSYNTPDHGTQCDTEFVGWYRFAGAAGTKMPTTRVPAYRCDTTFSGWLNGAHPTVEDGEVLRKVCFSDKSNGCKSKTSISVKNCSSYYIYKLYKPLLCPSRYCGTD